MIKISFKMKAIDYEKSFESLLPQLTEDCKSRAEDPTTLDKFIIKLGDDFVPVVNKLISYLDTDTRDQIVVWLIEELEEMIVGTLNKALVDMLGADAIVIGNIYALDEPGAKISLHAARIKTDSKKLADSPALTGFTGGLAKMIFSLTDPDTIETEAVGLLSSDYVKSQLITTLSDSLHEAGVHITLSDIVISQYSGEEEIPRIADPGEDEGHLPAAIEDPIIDALVEWLKQNKAEPAE